jgi:hypothetical protein
MSIPRLAQLPQRIRLRKCLRLLPSKAVKVPAHKQKISGRLQRGLHCGRLNRATDYEMWFPLGRHPVSITYSRGRSPDSGVRGVFRHVIGNAAVTEHSDRWVVS